MIRASAINKLERELSRARPGDDVSLRVYFAGQYKDVKVTAANLRDLPRRNRSMTIRGGDALVLPSLDRFKIDASGIGVDIGEHVRRALDEVRVATGVRGMDQLGRTFRVNGRVDW